MNIEQQMKDIIEQLNIWTKAYDEGHPLVTDKEYDDKYFELVQLEEQSGIRLSNSPTQTIDYEVVNGLTKVKHNHPMLSLAKTKSIDDLNKFIGNKKIIAMEKMDGLTCSLHYVNGKLISAETRGNGEIGEDILHNAKVLKTIPKTISFRNDLIVDGEVICTYASFEQWKHLYANPRNMAAGAIRLLDSRECAKYNLSFVAWDVISGFDDCKLLSQKLTKLSNYGFTCVDYFTNDAEDFAIENVIESLKQKATTSSYPIDGVVLKYDEVEYYQSLGKTAHHFSGGIAYKFYDEEYETFLRNIEWQVGRTSVLSPVAVFDAVDLDGALTTKASLSNLDVINTYLGRPYYGQRIKVARMNMVIPKITWGEKVTDDDKSVKFITTPVVCPSCRHLTEIRTSDSGIRNVYCSNPLCHGILLNKFTYFCGKAGMDIKGLSDATLDYLINWGWLRRYEDLFNLKIHRFEWIRKPGFSPTSVDKLLKSIEESKNCELWRFISAIGIPMVGPNMAKEIAKKEQTWADFEADINNQTDFSSWNNFGPEINNSIITFDYKEILNLAHNVLNIQNSLWEDPANQDKDLPLKDKTFVITGSLNHFENRDALKEKIESLGGKVVNSVSKKTDYLINNDNASESGKNLKAKELNIPIITEDEFISMFIIT